MEPFVSTSLAFVRLMGQNRPANRKQGRAKQVREKGNCMAYRPRSSTQHSLLQLIYPANS